MHICAFGDDQLCKKSIHMVNRMPQRAELTIYDFGYSRWKVAEQGLIISRSGQAMLAAELTCVSRCMKPIDNRVHRCKTFSCFTTASVLQREKLQVANDSEPIPTVSQAADEAIPLCDSDSAQTSSCKSPMSPAWQFDDSKCTIRVPQECV